MLPAKYRRAVPVGLVVLLVGASCGDDPVAPDPVVPARVVVVSGGDQTQTVGTALAQPLRVRVTDASGTPAPGVTVSWTVTGGGGAVSSASASTSGTGEASTTW
ncbi:MAG: Ig-like domain-containing protein, partial [Gemmatimonadota bacterium]|nr:Ig-like domain-containing protein [Gemmatimonadota bacterium]